MLLVQESLIIQQLCKTFPLGLGLKNSIRDLTQIFLQPTFSSRSFLKGIQSTLDQSLNQPRVNDER